DTGLNMDRTAYIYNYALTYGKYNLVYNDHPMTIDYYQKQVVSSQSFPYYIEEFILGFPKGIRKTELEALFNEAMKFTKPVEVKRENQLSIYMANAISLTWNRLKYLHKRPMETIYLDENIKDNLVKDLNKFLSREKLYLDHGIPYKRIYLLKGLPG